MSLENYKLCTLEDVNARQEIEGMDEDNITNLETLINAVSKKIIHYCNVPSFLKREVTEYLDGEGSNVIFPKSYPVNSISAIYDDPSWEYDSGSIIDPNNYRIVNARYIMLNQLVTNIDSGNIKIVYNAGFQTIPEDLKNAAVVQVVYEFKNRENSGFSSITRPDGTTNFMERGLLKEVKAAIYPYMRISY